MLNTVSIEKQIQQFIIENFLFGDDAELRDQDSLIEQGILDSLGVMEIVSYIEETFEIAIPDDELLPENLDSINNISQFVSSKLPA